MSSLSTHELALILTFLQLVGINKSPEEVQAQYKIALLQAQKAQEAA
jgi:hypothetical protein